MTQRPRVPLPAQVDLAGVALNLQVNHCKTPGCANFGVPARTEPGKTGPSADRDMNYKVHSTAKGKIPSIKCKACGLNPPVKSNAGIANETRRLLNVGGIPCADEAMGCGNPECENRMRPFASNPKLYWRRGKLNGAQCWQCRTCGRRTAASSPVRLHQRHRALAADLLSRVANKSPVRRASKGAGLKSTSSYYPIVDFLLARCRERNGAADRALMEGCLRLPREMTLESDCQVYTLNWVSRLDRRNVELSAQCTVDADSRFILGMHSNFDGEADPFAVNAEAARIGDMDAPEAFRRHARHWLAGDELRAGRAMARGVIHKQSLSRQIEALYAQAETRADVENIELQHHNETYLTPFMRNGLQVHMPYTAYAHWLILHRILKGARVSRVQASMDIDSMNRAAFLSAFKDEVGRGDAHAFYVRYDKHRTIDERRAVKEEGNRRRRAFARTLPPEARKDPDEALRRMMLAQLPTAAPYGKWRDLWVEHPAPTLNEPHKAVCWLTPHEAVAEGRKADLHLRAGLARIDNVFQMTRRLFNAFERPVGTSSTHNCVWHGYSPYNPEMVQKYLTIFRAVNNWAHVSEKDGKTPAMRLGLANKPLEYEDLLWPGQRVPRPKRSRRKGLKAAA